jgi:predicted DCC family thiol-disulfide oxidoreductase YuxK
MTTELHTATADKLLAYDGDCPMCLATVAWLLRLGLVRPDQTRSNHELTGAHLEAAHRAGIRNQLVVLDLQTGKTRAGSDGLLWIIGDNRRMRFGAWLLGLPGLRQLLRYAYETISYNRRVLSPPRHQIVCDCEPEVTVERRLTLVVPLVLAAIALAAAFGAAVATSWGLGDAAFGAVFIQIAAGAGWLVMIAAALVLLPGMQRIDYVAHLAVTMFTGALVALPAAIVMPLVPRPAAVAMGCLTMAASFALMFAMQRRRVAAQRLRSGWLWVWAVVLVATFAGSVVSHFREQIF